MKEKKMTEAICYRDGRIEELERRCSQQSDEISQLVARLCVVLLKKRGLKRNVNCSD